MRTPRDSGLRPREVARLFWPSSDETAHRAETEQVRSAARRVFPGSAGSGNAWYFSEDDVVRLASELGVGYRER